MPKSYKSENEGKVWVGTRNFEGAFIEPGTLALTVNGNLVKLSGETPDGHKVILDDGAVGYGPTNNKTGKNMWLTEDGSIDVGMIADANNDIGFYEDEYLTALHFVLKPKES